MLIYLDTRDLIDLGQHERPCSLAKFGKLLESGPHRLVLSLSTATELSAPLSASDAGTVVTQLLNQIERLALVYIRESNVIARYELIEACKAFSEKREYVRIDPFVDRFDEACNPFPRPLEGGRYRNFGLSELVFEIWQTSPGVFKPPGKTGYPFVKQRLEADRRRGDRSDPEQNFAFAVDNYLQLWQLVAPSGDVEDLSKWIYSDPNRCPSLRVADEVYHATRKNKIHWPSESYRHDFCHLRYLSYVDLISLDRTTRDYVKRASDRIMPGYIGRVCQDLNDILKRLV